MLLFVSELVIVEVRDARSMPTCGDVVTNTYDSGKIEISVHFQAVSQGELRALRSFFS